MKYLLIITLTFLALPSFASVVWDDADYPGPRPDVRPITNDLPNEARPGMAGTRGLIWGCRGCPDQVSPDISTHVVKHWYPWLD